MSEPFPKVPYRLSPLVFVGCVLVILALTWPWTKTFSTGFIRHWDPPFHAWKVELVAKAIMSGRVLPPNGNTNMYYPHSGALYYEALHWPQALLAAGLFHFTGNSVLVYHLVLVAFWALSGVCIWMMLLALGATNSAALFGAFVFVAMPYRISYMEEFNMQLNFALPLFFFYLIRFFQRPAALYVCGMALALWLQAVSELYQAVFLVLLMPFFVLGFWNKIYEIIRTNKKIWLYSIAAGIVFGVLTYIFLWPYYTLLSSQTLRRSIEEIIPHSIEPFTYFHSGLKHAFIKSPNVQIGEMSVYPTMTLIVLSIASMLYGYYRELSVKRTAETITSSLTVLCLAAFGGISLLYYHTAFDNQFLLRFYSRLPQLTVLVLFAYLIFARSRNIKWMFARSLFAGAVFSFFMTLGPYISLQNSGMRAINTLYMLLYSWLEALHGFRVVSRFSIFIMIFMIVATALFLSMAQRRYKLHTALICLLYMIFSASIAYESIPRNIDIHLVDDLTKSSVLEKLGQMETEAPYVLAILPMGDRNVDSRHMLQIAGNTRLSVYAWGGTYPPLTQKIVRLMGGIHGDDPAEAVRILRQLWPECYILEDVKATLEQNLAKYKRLRWRFKDIYHDSTDVVAEDNKFVLMRLHKDIEPEKEKIRLVRQDFVDNSRNVVFSAYTPEGSPGAEISLYLNDTPLGKWNLSHESREFTVEIPKNASIPLKPNVFRFVSTDGVFVLDSFNLAK